MNGSRGATSLRRGLGVVVAAVVMVAAVAAIAPAKAKKGLTQKKADGLYVTVGESASDAGLLDGKDSTEFAGIVHSHAGGDITSGTVAEARIDPSVARDSEIMPTVLGSDGAGSTLDADTLDGAASAASLTPGAVYLSDGTGLLPTNTVGAGSIVDVTRSIPVPIHELDEAFTTGIFPGKTMVGGAPALAFDGTTDEAVSFAVPFPPDGIGSGTARLRLSYSSAATSGNIRLDCSMRAVAQFESIVNGGILIGASSTVGPSGAPNDRQVVELCSTSLTNLSPGDLLVLKLGRVPGDAGDTLSGDMNLYALEVVFGAAQ